MRDQRDWMMLASEQDPDVEFCNECYEECTGKWEDIGIGSYECFGAKGTHRQMTYMSTCCDGEVIKNCRPYEGPTPEEEEADRGDWLYEQKRDDELMRKLEEEGGG